MVDFRIRNVQSLRQRFGEPIAKYSDDALATAWLAFMGTSSSREYLNNPNMFLDFLQKTA